jgi:hypothetical protein
VWQLTPQGVAYVRDHAGPLTAEELDKIVSVEPHDTLWSDRLARARADAEWMAERAANSRSREAILPDMRALVRRYLGREIPLEELRSVFDQKTRNGSEWESFGFGGMSGAMVLNQLCKNIGDRSRVDDEVRALLREPASDAEAANALKRFAAFLETQRKTVANIPPPNRALLFASGLWHIQAPVRWPVHYPSARDALVADGLYDPDAGADIADNYLAFRQAFQDLAQALKLGTWELESLLRWTQRGKDGDDEVTTRKQRVWLMALGRNADAWEECHKNGIAAIGFIQQTDLRELTTLEEMRAAIRAGRDNDVEPMNDGLACWEFLHDMRPGDTIYVKRGRHFIVGEGIVKSDYRFDPKRPFPHVRDVDWRAKGQWRPREKALTTKTLTEITGYPGLVNDIRKALSPNAESGPDVTRIAAPAEPVATYSLDDAEGGAVPHRRGASQCSGPPSLQEEPDPPGAARRR